MSIQLRRAPVTGCANEIERRIAKTRAANGPEAAGREIAHVVIGASRGMMPRRPLACAPGDVAVEVVLLDDVGT